jgi:hypothetical protein
MGKIIWADCVKNKKELRIVKEERNILCIIRRQARWIFVIWRKNCLPKHVAERKINI